MLLPPGRLSVTLEMEVPPKRTKTTMVFPAALGALNEMVPELPPEGLEPAALCTSTGAAPVRVKVAPLPPEG